MLVSEIKRVKDHRVSGSFRQACDIGFIAMSKKKVKEGSLGKADELISTPEGLLRKIFAAAVIPLRRISLTEEVMHIRICRKNRSHVSSKSEIIKTSHVQNFLVFGRNEENQ